MSTLGRPITIGRYKPSWKSIVLPYVAGAVVAAGLCSFLFVKVPSPPEREPPAQAQVVEVPVGKTPPVQHPPKVQVVPPPTLKPAAPPVSNP